MNFSIILITFNRSFLLKKNLERLVKIICKQGTFELIIVNNNSKDDTEKVILNFQKKYPNFPIVFIRESRQGPSFARNTGIRMAQYKRIIFLDDDIVMPEDFLFRYYKAFSKYPEAAIIGGKIVVKGHKKIVKLLNYLKYNEWVYAQTDLGNLTKRIQYPRILHSGNMAVNKQLLKNPFFNEKLGVKYHNFLIFGEDFELCFRAHLERQVVIYDSSIKAINIVEDERLNFNYIFKRFIGAGIERSIIDNILKKKYIQHKTHGPDTKLMFNLLKCIFQNQERGINMVRLVKEMLFEIGYYYNNIGYTLN